LAAEATQLGDAGCLVAQQDGEQAACDRQTDAFGLGGASKLSLAVGIDDDGSAALYLERLEAFLQIGGLLVQPLYLSLLWGHVEIAQDGVGLTIETLTRDAAVVGMLGDVAALAEENDGGTGKAERWTYDAHGVSDRGDAVGGSSTSLQLLTPLLSTPQPFFARHGESPEQFAPQRNLVRRKLRL
jgi:hypothetical protein